MLLAVLHRHAGIACFDQDVFVNAVGGVRISEPAADLAVMLAIQSSLRGKPLPRGFVAFGEVGLAGEVRPAPRGQERLKEAAKLGFSVAIVPKANAPKKADRRPGDPRRSSASSRRSTWCGAGSSSARCDASFRAVAGRAAAPVREDATMPGAASAVRAHGRGRKALSRRCMQPCRRRHNRLMSIRRDAPTDFALDLSRRTTR